MESSPNNKVAKKTLYIGTHDGKFHCDEVLACYMLRIDECDIVVDVGGVYDPSTHRYDHHQK